MKKGIFSIVALVYFLAFTGWEINIHYCMGRVDSISLLSTDKEHCNTCGMPTAKNNGCCHDENQFVRLTQDQKLPVYHSFHLFKPITTKISFHAINTFASSNIPVASPIVLDLPPPSTPLFVRNQVFRI